MISQPTAERMRAAGFPQASYLLRFPYFDEIVDAIGPRYQGLAKDPSTLRWQAFALRESCTPPPEGAVAREEDCVTVEALSPEEAVAALWLALFAC